MSSPLPGHHAISALLAEHDLGAVLLRRPPNFAWYTGGADNRVDHSSPVGVADLVITRDGEYVVTNDIEARRFRDEHLPDTEVIDYPWYDDPAPVLGRLIGGGRLGSDTPFPGAVGLEAHVARLRRVLDERALELYREVGRETTAAMQETVSGIRPGMTDYEASGALEQACRRRGLYAALAMAAADDRIALYRHPVTHGDPIRRRVMLVVCAERGGLYANLTRFVEIEPLSAELAERFAACRDILRRMRTEATQAGRTLADAFEDCRRFYAEAGYPDEWRLHHQGGMTGYATREVVATPHTHDRIEPNQAFAWNPSITGAKAEETFLLTDAGTEPITGDV